MIIVFNGMCITSGVKTIMTGYSNPHLDRSLAPNDIQLVNAVSTTAHVASGLLDHARPRGEARIHAVSVLRLAVVI